MLLVSLKDVITIMTCLCALEVFRIVSDFVCDIRGISLCSAFCFLENVLGRIFWCIFARVCRDHFHGVVPKVIAVKNKGSCVDICVEVVYAVVL